MSAESTEEAVDTPAEYLRERTRADPGLTPEERETTFTFAVDEDMARVHSEEAAIIRRFLCHEAVEVDRVGIYDGDTTRTVSIEDAGAQVGADDLVVSLRGRVPLRYLVLKEVGRNHDEHAQVVSKEVLSD